MYCGISNRQNPLTHDFLVLNCFRSRWLWGNSCSNRYVMSIACMTAITGYDSRWHSYTTCSVGLYTITLFPHTQSYYHHVDNEENNNSNIPVIVGVTVAAVVLLVLVALLIILCCCCRSLICPCLGRDKVEENGRCKPSHPGPPSSQYPHQYLFVFGGAMRQRNLTAWKWEFLVSGSCKQNAYSCCVFEYGFVEVSSHHSVYIPTSQLHRHWHTQWSKQQCFIQRNVLQSGHTRLSKGREFAEEWHSTKVWCNAESNVCYPRWDQNR